MAPEHLEGIEAAIARNIRTRFQAGRRSLEGRIILLVDDNVEYRSLIKALLMRRHSCRIREAADGRSALAQVRWTRPDLVILDFAIPKLNGYEVLQEIRRRDESRRLPVIMLTGVANRRQLKGMNMDISAFLEKPVTWKELIESMAKALEAAYGSPPIAAPQTTPPQAPSGADALSAVWPAFPPVGTSLPLKTDVPCLAAGAPQQRAVDYQELLRIQEEFLKELGYDLRAPLTSIICALRLLIEKSDDGLDSDERRFLDICLRNSQRLEALLRDVFRTRRKPLAGTPASPTSAIPGDGLCGHPPQPRSP
jgi:CheY-like chemotaxis protein